MEDADIVKEAVALDGRAVLATIVYVEGHAYRKAGAAMLLKPGNGSSGALSPGCLEADLQEYASRVHAKGVSEMIEYDMRAEDDLSWGEHIGCGGLVRILLEPVIGELLQVMKEAGEWLERGVPARLIRKFDDGLLPAAYRVEAAGAGASEARIASDNNEWSICWTPPPRLVLFGAGDDALPVCQLARMAGFRVTVTDFREALCTAQRFPEAETIFGFPAETLPLLAIRSDDYVVVMSHQFQRDSEFVQLVLPLQPRYVGIMGSMSRTERMLGRTAQHSRLHYPVGLPIGSDGSMEIAFSIVSELISVRRGGRAHDAAGNRGTLFGSGGQPPHGTAETIHPARRR